MNIPHFLPAYLLTAVTLVGLATALPAQNPPPPPQKNCVEGVPVPLEWYLSVRDEHPVSREPRAKPAPTESHLKVHPDRPLQVITGLGFEIQSDSIKSGNEGLSGATTSVPHDLLPTERTRFYKEMLAGFRYCRLAGGLYLRGTDADGRQLAGRWPEQLEELREMITVAGIEGVSLEYWSPTPYWKANRKYVGADGSENVLRCFSRNFTIDPDYQGDINRFLRDFSSATAQDIRMLNAAGVPVVIWGLQNEPETDTPYASCVYRSVGDYALVYRMAAQAVRAVDPKIKLIGDTFGRGERTPYIDAVLADPMTEHLVDWIAVHHVGMRSEDVKLWPKPPLKPTFQNEYEYLKGPSSPDRCMNTVQHIMNWFQLRQSPSWFWIHALKPVGNEEASGYSLGFWQPANANGPVAEGTLKGLKPGHWTWNKYNWHAVGSFVRHLQWDSTCVAVDAALEDPDLRHFAFRRPDGHLVIVVSNRSRATHTYNIDTGLVANATFRGYRYTPEDAGKNFGGVPLTPMSGTALVVTIPDQAWEFWVQD